MSSSGHEGPRMMSALRMDRFTRQRLTAGCIVGACLALAVTTPAAAQSAGEPLTLAAAMERALAANPAIATGRLGKAIALAGLAVAGERPNPEASIELEKETPKQSFGIAVPLELGGKRARRIAVSRAAVEIGDAELAATIAQVRNEVRRSYFDILIAEARLGVLQELREVAQRARSTAQTRYELGDAPRLDVVQADSALSTADAEVLAATGVVQAGRAKLNALLGLPLDSVRPLATTLEPGEPIVASTVVERASAGSSELVVLDRRIDEQRAKLALARALRVPDAVPSVALTHDSEPEFTYGWRAGVAITLPLFTTHKAAVAVEDATVRQLTAQREAARLRIVGEVTAAALTAESQRKAYVQYRDVILPQARQVEELAQDSYRLGQTGLAALLQALQASRDVRLRSLDVVSQFQTGVAELERTIGAPLP